MPHFIAWAPHSGTTKSNIVAIHQNHVASFSPDLSSRGISRGDTVIRARALCPDAQFIAKDIESEKQYLHTLIDRFLDITPQVQPILDAHTPLWVLLQGFSRSDFEQLLKDLNAKGGYTTSPTLSQLSALYAKAGELCVVPPHEEQLLLKAIPTHYLSAFGYGRHMIEFLEILGFTNLFVLTNLTKKQLKAQFATEGTRLYELLHPTQLKPKVPFWHRQSCSAEIEIPWDGDIAQLECVLSSLVQSLLRQKDSITELILCINRDNILSTKRSFTQPTRDAQFLHRCSIEFLKKLSIQTDHIHHLELIAFLRNTPATQGDLWKNPQWEQLRSTLIRRFPHRIYQPTLQAEYFLPEHAYTLTALSDIL